MSHAVYQSKAIILGKKNMRESNVLYTLYTERFGLIYASAQSIRSVHSKMRSHMHVLSCITVDLVEGRDIWKLTGVHEHTSSFLFAHTDWYPFLNRIAKLVNRLVKGEEAHDELWHDYEKLYILYEAESELDLVALELIFVTRLLYHLGYWNGNEAHIHDSDPFQEKYYQDVLSSQKSLIREINRRLIDTQL